MDISIFCPLHITELQDIYMARYQVRFFKRLKKRYPNLVCILTLDEDRTCKFSEMIGDMKEIIYHDLTKEKNYGIVFPTKKAISTALKFQSKALLRITQDTQIEDEAKLSRLLDQSQEFDNFIIGCKDTCCDIKNYLKEIGIEQTQEKYDFVQGNFIYASMKLWNEYYNQLPQSVKHYCDDSIFSYLVENKGGIKPLFIKDFWKHNRTRDIYYLESLYA